MSSRGTAAQLADSVSEGGVSGVAVLAESHISIHTWPENGYAAIDIDSPERLSAVLEVIAPLHESGRASWEWAHE